jgi:glycosyltransferase involved in cell wall biosynthesis
MTTTDLSPRTPKAASRHILFVYTNLSQLGGIETLIVRLSRRLHALGHRVTILVQAKAAAGGNDPALIEEVLQFAEVRLIHGWFRQAPGCLRDLDLHNVDYLYACESNSLLLATVIQAACAPAARIVAGIYHSREYGTRQKVKRYRQRLVEDIFAKMPAQNLFFMNEACAREHTDSVGRDFGDSPIIPLAIDAGRFASNCRRPDRNRIVSVGRITDFKTYNFTMLEAIRDLRARGRRVQYHVYGDGEQLPLLKQRVRECGLEECVTLHGPLPYGDFGAVMADAGVFVGMGTALLEAAACGVPALVAPESIKRPVTYGFLHELQGYNIGEYVAEATEYKLADKIGALMDLDPAAYEESCARSRARADDFSIEAVTDRLLACLEETVPFSYRITVAMRLRDELDLWQWRTLRALGVEDPYKSRFVRISPLGRS